MDLLPSLECLGPLTHGRAPSLALDLMLGTRLIARGYANHTLKSRAQQLAEQHAAEWRARIDDPAAAAAAPLPRLREALAELVEAERLGQPHAALALALRRAVEATPPADFLGFDALRGPPPDVRVGAGWRLWARALLHAYTAQRAGVAWHPAVGVADVLGWLPRRLGHSAAAIIARALVCDLRLAVSRPACSSPFFDAPLARHTRLLHTHESALDA